MHGMYAIQVAMQGDTAAIVQMALSVSENAYGHGVIRHFMHDACATDREYQFRWRSANVGASVISVDDNMKVNKKQTVQGTPIARIKRTVWSNDLNCPLISCVVNSTSMTDPAFVSAVNVYQCIAEKDGRAPVCLCYLDAIKRDGPAILDLFPSLKDRDEPTNFEWPGEVFLARS